MLLLELLKVFKGRTFCSFLRKVAKGNFARTGVMSYIQIPCAILLGAIFYGERPELTAYLGTILIFLAGIVVIYKAKINN